MVAWLVRHADNRDDGEGAAINKLIFWSMTVTFFLYSAYVWTEGTVAPQSAKPTPDVVRGQKLYQEKNCMACHQFYGLGGYMGPDLTNVISRMGPDYARAFMIGGTERMPNFALSQQEMDDIVAFLGFVDTMGLYQAPKYDLKWYGTVASLND